MSLGSDDPIESRELAVNRIRNYRDNCFGWTAVWGAATIAFACFDGPEDVRVAVASGITVSSAFGTAAYACVYARRSRDLEGARESLS